MFSRFTASRYWFSVTNKHTYRFLSGCEEVEHCISQLAEPYNFPQPHNTTLLYKFYLATTQILEYTPTQRLPHMCLPHELVCNDGARISAVSTFTCELVRTWLRGSRISNLTVSHNLATPSSCTNLTLQLHEC